jgi:hypothetical protein
MRPLTAAIHPCLAPYPPAPWPSLLSISAANTLKVIPNNAIRWMVFEHLKQSPHFKKLFVSFNVESAEKQPAKGRLE